MSETNEKIISEIRQKLINKEMSVLIGSGFSRNANKNFPLWKDLLIDMVIELFKTEYRIWITNNPHKNNKDFLGLKLFDYDYFEIVEKYLKYKGIRESLTFYIESKIKPIDDNYRNLDMGTHKKLLYCPWNNIYTTNYDTLLEQGVKALGKNYEIVKDSQSLSVRPQNRIIKLHGSLRTDTEIENREFGFDGDYNSQYIISKSDYADYEIKHPAFTHLMRIALLQEAFCLIGFSGDDPNFLGWVDWVREILTKSKKKKIYFIDVSKEKCNEERILFFNNHQIEYLHLNNIYGNLNKKELVGKFLDDISPEINKQGEIDFSQIKNNYFKLWGRIEKCELFSMEFKKILDEIEDNEKYFRLACFSIYFKAELIINKKINKIIDLIKDKKIKILEGLNFISLLQRNSYYNLSNFLSPEQLNLLADEFNSVNYNKLEGSDQKKWITFGISLLKNYRHILKKDEFNKLFERLLRIDNLDPSFIEEIYYEKSLIYAISLDYKRLINSLQNWKITEENSGWACIRKAFLLNSLKINKFNDEIIKLINESVKRTIIEQEKLWFYEITSSYIFSTNLTKDEIILNRINELKTKGFYTLDNIINSLINNKKNEDIKPSEESRYTITTSFGMDSRERIDWDYIKFTEFIFNSGYPLIPDIKYPINVFNKNKWFDIFIKIYKGMPQEMLFLSFQYSGNDASENYIRAISQKIVFNKEIPNKMIIKIFQNYSKAFFYYYTLNIYQPSFLFIISELIECIEFKYWKEFINKLWDLHLDKSTILNQKIYSSIWGLDKILLKLIPYIEENKLLNKMIIYLFELSNNLNDKERERVILKYIEKIINNTFFKPYKSSINRNSYYINQLLEKIDFSGYDLIKIYRFNESFSDSFHDRIINKVISIKFSENNILYWSLILKLCKNNKNVNDKLREYLLSNNNYIFHTGINQNGGRSGGGLYFSIYKTFKAHNNKYYLNWSSNQIKYIYNILENSFRQLSQYNNKIGIENNFFFQLDDIDILYDMLQFLKQNKEILTKNKNYYRLFDQIKTLYEKEGGFKDIISGLLSDNSNLIQNSIIALTNRYKEKPNEINEVAWITLLMRILRKDKMKLELAIENLSYILSDVISDKKWPLKYKSFYLNILGIYQGQIPIEYTNRTFVEYYLIKIANSLRINWKLRDPIIKKWLETKKESHFLKIKNMRLKKSH